MFLGMLKLVMGHSNTRHLGGGTRPAVPNAVTAQQDTRVFLRNLKVRAITIFHTNEFCGCIYMESRRELVSTNLSTPYWYGSSTERNATSQDRQSRHIVTLHSRCSKR